MLTHTLACSRSRYHILDAFLCLLAVGVLLGMVRVCTGNIAAPIGLHAGWVAVIYVVRAATERDPDAPGAWMLGEFDGFIGWLVLAWTLVLGITLSWWYRPGARERGETPAPLYSFTTVSRRPEAFDRVVELEQRLFVGELDGQQFGEPRADPGGIVELSLDVLVVLGELFERAAHRGRQALAICRQRQLGLGRQPGNLAHVQAIARRATRAARGTCARPRS